MSTPVGRPVGGPVGEALDRAHREQWALVLASTVRLVGDLDVAEECVQDAFLSAVRVWGERGIPDNPGAWLNTTARRRAIDLIRREQTLRSKLPLLVEPVAAQDDPVGTEEDAVIPDDRLRLVFTCAHPALSPQAREALTLRLVCGLTTAQVGRAFLVSEATAAARITRAKKKIAAARIPYRTPPPHELPERLDTVLTVVHLLFTAGHTAGEGDDLTSPDLLRRSVDLARMLHTLMPDEREVRGLLALLLLTDARRPARTARDGSLVLLEDQDRSRWDAASIEEGRTLVAQALRGAGRLGRPGRFALQAAIAAVHAEASSYADTDWHQVLALYDALLAAWPSPVVALNRAVALAMTDGPAAALAAVQLLDGDPRLRGYPYLPATRADLLRRLGRDTEARAAYLQAAELTGNATERAFLHRRIAELGTPSP